MAVILSLNNNIDNELRSLGHEVITKQIRQHGYYSALELLNECATKPDFFIQKEIPGIRVMINDLHALPCRTAFWSIDTHLNYFWQMYYARLFDVFLTPHKAFIERLPLEWQHPNCHRLAQNGYNKPFMAHNERKHKINFVGRLSGTRSQRVKIAELLSTKYSTEIIDEIAFTDMMNLYADTCIIPNESIANEVNFRLLEGASCGACVLCPPVGEDQDILFKPDHEMLIYNSLEELETLLDFCLRKSDICEKIGYAAWQRVQKEHTEQHRAKQLYKAIQGENSTREQDKALDYFKFCLDMLNIFDDSSKIYNFSKQEYKTQAFSIVAKLFNLAQETSSNAEKKIELDNLFNQADTCLLASNVHIEHKKMLCIAFGGAAIEAQDEGRSLFYLLKHEKLCNTKQLAPQKQSLIQIALAWVKALKAENKQTLTGQPYKKGCYLTAFDFATLCRTIDPFGKEWIEALNMLDHVLHSFPLHERAQLKELLD